MATKGERQALLFLAAVALLGAGARVYRGHHSAAPTDDLDRQIGAVESSAPRGRKGGRGVSPRKHARTSTVPERTDSAAIPVTAPSPSFVPQPQTPARIDLDVASASDIVRLPGVGPAIAK